MAVEQLFVPHPQGVRVLADPPPERGYADPYGVGAFILRDALGQAAEQIPELVLEGFDDVAARASRSDRSRPTMGPGRTPDRAAEPLGGEEPNSGRQEHLGGRLLCSAFAAAVLAEPLAEFATHTWPTKQKAPFPGPFAVAGARYGPISDRAIPVEARVPWPI